MKNCNCLSEMPRDGSGQLGRYLKALDPTYVQIDCRSMEDLLVFAKRYAAQIRFYDLPESNIQETTEASKVSWYEFFRRDMAVIAASISVVDLAKLKQDYDQNREVLEANPNATTLNDLFDPILLMVVQIDHWYSLAIPENPLHTDLDLAINSTLCEQVRKIIAYEEGYKSIDPKHPLHLDFSAIDNSSLWGLDETIDPDPSIYEGTALGDRIRFAALYIDDIFHTFYGFMTDLVEVKATGYMHFALESYPSHQPHMALFITFLELFRLTQEQMNGLTGRMLDFYYQDVLRLAPKPSIADRVHIVFELAKDVTGYDLAQATALKAGKDGSGKEQIYITETDLVINQAKVRELKTVFVQKSAAPVSTSATIESIYARPVANSYDGFGEKSTDPSGKWPTFGKGTPGLKKAKNICQKIEQEIESASRKDQAQIGFAIASPQLLLQGGNRLIIWRINGLKELLYDSEQAVSFDLDIWLTGKNGWLKIADELDETEYTKLIQVERFGIFDPTLAAKSGYYVDLNSESIRIFLPMVETAIVPFNAKVHTGYPYTTSYPVAQLMLAPHLGINYSTFQRLGLRGQAVATIVGSIIIPPTEVNDQDKIDFNKLFAKFLAQGDTLDGLKTLVLQNDAGAIDANKPFDPYTTYPSKGKSFYIGSAEIFNKPLKILAVNIKKTQDSEDSGSSIESIEQRPEYSVSVLTNKRWDRLSNNQGTSFSRLQLMQNILMHAYYSNGIRPIIDAKPFMIDRIPILPVTELQSQTVKGFIRITNMIPVSESDNVSFEQSNQSLAQELQIKEISVSYLSVLTKLDPAIDQFFHVYPFGVTEVVIPVIKDIASWLVLGPIYNTPPEKPTAEAPEEAYAKDIILDIENNSSFFTKIKKPDFAPKKTDTEIYGFNGGVFTRQELKWRVMSFTRLDSDNIQTIKDNIHKDLAAVGESSRLADNIFYGKHHALAFFLVYIVSPESRKTTLCVRSDDSIRVWLNGSEIEPLRYLDDRDINQETLETCSEINLLEGCNVLLVAVAETEGEWAFSACLTNNLDGLFISPEQPGLIKNLFKLNDKAINSLLVNANGSLLPQFTWLSPNAVYQSAFSDQAATKDNLAVMEAIVREASGIKGGNSQYSGLVQEEGMLFIGLEKLRPFDTLSLLFQFAEGSAEDEDNDPPEIHWSYLTNNMWRPLKGENLISDGTFGFQTTGIIKLEVPEDSTDHNTIITDGLRWFCASVTENSKRIPMLVNVVAQAVEASFQDNGNDQSHFDKALPAGSIGKLAVSVAQVSKVEQPFASFDGKHQEVGKEFYTRVSERLRHKARAITPWDYEHLVLDRFPSIYKVKCITHTDPNCLCRTSSLSESTCCGPQIAPGHLLIVTIANLKNRNAANPLQPKTSRRTLLEIQDYLGKRTSPFVHVHAKNPVYEQVLVFFKVQFIPGSDKGYYLKKLNDEIIHYLTPWAFDENAEISFAQKFYASAIINFIEERSYVDFITDFFMFVCRDTCCPTVNITVSKSSTGTSTNIADLLASVSGCRDMEELIASNDKFIGEVIAEPSTVRSILVSAPKHIIIPYEAPVELSECEKRKKAQAQQVFT